MVLSMFHFAINVQDVLLGKVVCPRSLKYYLLKIVADGRLDEKLVFLWCYLCLRCVAWKGGVSKSLKYYILKIVYKVVRRT